MITFRTSADVPEDRHVVVNLPPETPVGRAELVVTVVPQGSKDSARGSVRRWFGSVRSGDARSADNERIDADLARSYANPPE